MSSASDASERVFPATRWSLVERARQSDEVASREGLKYLLQQYLPALRAHLVGVRRFPVERADDLLQGFVADKIIEQRLLDHARESAGKFRSFLLVTLKHYVVSALRRESAACRHPEGGFAAFDERTAAVEGGDDPPEQFNVAWARELLAEALRRMQAECVGGRRADVWAVFEGRLLREAFEGQATDYPSLVRQLGLATPLEACRLLATAKRMFGRHLRAVAAEYAGADGDAEVELDDLRRILAGVRAQTGPRPRS
jgi:hypothetical protein